MNSFKLDDIFKFLLERNFEIDENIPCALKCGKCDKLLINSYVGPCLCRYCRKCIDEMLTDGTEKCPGKTDDCNEEQLSNFLSDNPTNFKISKLVLKCPEQMCSHKCEISKMEEHLRVCTNKCSKCPLHECDKYRLSADEMRDHLHIIENLRNELNILKENEKANKEKIEINKDVAVKNKYQLELLSKGLKMKDENIASMNREIQRIKQLLTENSRMKDEMIAEMQQQIRSIKEKRQQTAAEINNLKIESDNKITDLREEMTKECQDIVDTEVTQINDDHDKWQLQLTSRIDVLEEWRDKQMDGTVVMKIKDISYKRLVGTRIFSEVFYPKTNSYKMQLEMINVIGSDQFDIVVHIHSGEMDTHLKWPFHADVTIKITNKFQPDASKSIKKHYTIPKPNENSHRGFKPFQFSYAELKSAGLMQNNCFIIECLVE